MCGIAGFCLFDSQPQEVSLLKKMTDTMSRRGPDDAGYEIFSSDEFQIGLGQRRLSILDLSHEGHQPMTFRELHLIFNGEIYNFEEIRQELLGEGYTFSSSSDTEVIIKSFHCWGEKCVDKFIGMFSFVIYDEKEKYLFLYRDRCGVKPLYYYWNGNLLLFASELKAFHEHPEFHRNKKVDTNSLSLFLQFSYIPAPHTIFEDTYKLKPGHFIKINLLRKEKEEVKYWDVVDYYNLPKLKVNEREAIDTTEALLKKAYSYRMVADVPVGVFLSGGYDSTSVAALLQSERSNKLKTFSIGFYEDKFNEAPEAAKIAKYLGTDHYEHYVTPSEAADILPSLPDIYDEPFADNSVVPTTLLSRFTAQHVKVALSGDGGDEIFGGYNKFNQSVKYASLFPRPLSLLVSGMMGFVNPDYIPFARKQYNFSSRYEKMKNIWKEGSSVAAMKYISQYITENEVKSFLANPYQKYATDFEIEGLLNSNNDALNKMLAVDYKTFLVDNNLVKVDRATMWASIEGREPMLDQNIIEYVSRLPSELKVKNGINKYLLKEIVHRYVPREIMNRPKMPFIAPLSVWFKDQLQTQMKEHLSFESLKDAGIFDPAPVVKFRDRYLAGEQVVHQKLWNILVFQLWYKRWMN